MIIPGILRENLSKINTDLKKVFKVAKLAQIDVCDGKFVKYKTWLPEKEVDLYGWENLDFEFDLMVENKNFYLEIVKDLGASFVILHISDSEDYNLKFAREFCNQYEIKLGVCASEKYIDQNLQYIDYIQIMGIEDVGRQGAELRTDILDQIEKYKKYNLPLQIDGAMNEKSIKYILKNSKAQIKNFVVGSAIFASDDELNSFNKLEELVSTYNFN